MRFVSFLQRLGYLVFLQVLLLPSFSIMFHVSLGHNFRFFFASFCYCCSYMYFILVRPFVLACLCSIRLREPILFGTKYFCLCLRSGTARLQEPVLFRKNSLGYTVQGRSALGPGFLFKTKY